MNAVVEVETASMVPAKSANPTAEVVAHAKTVQQVMQAVMKPNVHYGTIPGAGDKPTLLKSGAEVLCMTFRIADRYEVTDLSRDGAVRYRVNCIGEHQTTTATPSSITPALVTMSMSASKAMPTSVRRRGSVERITSLRRCQRAGGRKVGGSSQERGPRGARAGWPETRVILGYRLVGDFTVR